MSRTVTAPYLSQYFVPEIDSLPAQSSCAVWEFSDQAKTHSQKVSGIEMHVNERMGKRKATGYVI